MILTISHVFIKLQFNVDLQKIYLISCGFVDEVRGKKKTY